MECIDIEKVCLFCCCIVFIKIVVVVIVGCVYFFVSC